MDNPTAYLLIGDRCERCQYVENVFTLLKLPLASISIEQIQVFKTRVQHALAVIACDDALANNSEFADFLQKCLKKTPFIHLLGSNSQILSINHAPHLQAPFTIYDLKTALKHCSKAHREEEEWVEHPAFTGLVGKSKHIRKIKAMIHQVAACDSNVLIFGQSGTGKEVIASCIHHLSNRQSKPLVPINCGAIPSELMESELFGHEKGAFTGAATRRAGRFELANHGTLFLDEIGDMPFPMQVKLLRVIQDRKVERVGSVTSIDVDVRLIAATNQHLEELIEKHQFREDLYYRLNVFPIHVPALCERAEDIPLLIDYYLDKIFSRLNHRVVFTEHAIDILCHYDWPGNIRELSNFLERMVILHQDQIVDENDIDPHYRQRNNLTTIPLPIVEAETMRRMSQPE